MILKLTHNDAGHITSFLNTIKDDFGFALDKKVNIEDFSKKILSLGHCFGYFSNGLIVGIVGGYCNNLESSEGYISIVGISKKYRRCGIAQKLINRFEEYTKEYHIKIIRIHTSNTNALELYKKLGFILEKKSLNFENNTQYHLFKSLI